MEKPSKILQYVRLIVPPFMIPTAPPATPEFATTAALATKVQYSINPFSLTPTIPPAASSPKTVAPVSHLLTVP